MKNKLIPLEDLCQQVSTEFMAPKKPFDKNYWLDKILNYTSFILKDLNVSMFVPAKLVNGDWVVFEEPNPNKVDYLFYIKEFEEAKERVLFEGFERFENYSSTIKLRKEGFKVIFYASPKLIDISTQDSSNYIEFIKDIVRYNLTLTPTGQKQSGL